MQPILRPYGGRVHCGAFAAVLDREAALDFPAEMLMRGTPAGRAGHPDAIAAAAVYLASDDAAFVHGIVVDVDGGRTTVAVGAGRTRCRRVKVG
ncbi:SDR family oxidoreductase [Nocardia arthritidis]|uniref:SDR family oxidoreductase n=1 Tax=Nocardia arthritidis TaxID=228602 RepID=UPI0007A3AA9B|nr:SDR family oxidoreductase [Nocardia arthritidis]